MKKIFLILAVSLLGGAAANAGFLVDPYFGYTASGTTSSSSLTAISGTELGGRFGYSTMGFGFGLDAVIAGTTTFTTSGTATNYAPFHYGVFASYKFPVLVRAYVSYLLSTKDTESVTKDYITGTATKIGVQYTGLPFVAIGLEMFSGTASKYTLASTGTVVNFTPTQTQTRITISVPFEL